MMSCTKGVEARSLGRAYTGSVNSTGGVLTTHTSAANERKVNRVRRQGSHTSSMETKQKHKKKTRTQNTSTHPPKSTRKKLTRCDTLRLCTRSTYYVYCLESNKGRNFFLKKTDEATSSAHPNQTTLFHSIRACGWLFLPHAVLPPLLSLLDRTLLCTVCSLPLVVLCPHSLFYRFKRKSWCHSSEFSLYP